tara:strand:- start:72 stop:311 length:240 start_codon:yes stop_codon:yes gene_type:complete
VSFRKNILGGVTAQASLDGSSRHLFAGVLSIFFEPNTLRSSADYCVGEDAVVVTCGTGEVGLACFELSFFDGRGHFLAP